MSVEDIGGDLVSQSGWDEHSATAMAVRVMVVHFGATHSQVSRAMKTHIDTVFTHLINAENLMSVRSFREKYRELTSNQ